MQGYCWNLHQLDLSCRAIVQEEHSLKPPDQAYLQGLEPGQMARGQGKSDFIDAVSVAADILNKAVQMRPELEKHSVTKEIVLISSLQDRVKEAEVHEFVAALVESLKQHDVRNITTSLESIPEHCTKRMSSICACILGRH